MFIITDDPYRDFERYDRESTAWLGNRPVCYRCNQHIQEDRLWVINDEFYHEECAEDEFKKWTEDYIL